MVSTASILSIVPGLQATSILALNVKNAKMDLKTSKTKINPMKMVKAGVGTLVGINLLKPTAMMISKI